MASTLLVSVSEAQVYTLSELNSVAQVDVTQNAGVGMNLWTVSGVNQLAQQWFWYRVGNGPQRTIDTISAPSVTQGGPTDLSVVYSNDQLSIQVDYFLSGATGGNADILESITLQNNSGFPLDLHFFQYSDFNLAGDPKNDSVSIHLGLFGYDLATQTRGPLQISETVVTPPADRAEANYSANTVTNLNNTPGYDLNDVTSAGPGDVTWAYQWNFTVAPGAQVNVFKDKRLSVEPVSAIIKPMISCPTNITVECGQSTDPSSTGTATATSGGCTDSPTVTYSDATSGTCPETITRTWTASDSCGTNSCVQVITIQDTTPPTISCPPDKQLQCGESADPAHTGMATATDVCGPVPITFSDTPTPANCTGEPGIARTWTATDACNNSSTCVQQITFVDTTPPVITCPPDKQLQCGDSTDPAHTGSATATDNCAGTVTITFTDAVTSTNCAGKPGIARTWTATDGCNNMSACVQQISFADTAPPSITCPPDKQLQCGDSTAPANTGSATATDNCGGTVTITFTDALTPANCTGKAGIARTWKAADACDNSATCVQQITFVDTTAPSMTCPPDKQLQCGDSTDPSNTGSATATDNCGGTVTITFTDAPTAANCTGKAGIARTWKATDGCNNSSTCVQQITFVDTTSPAITCPPNAQLQCGASTAPTNTGSATATDNCGGMVIITYTDAPTPANCTGKPGIARTWKATDSCNNSSTCVQQISFVDATPPTITCPSNMTITNSVSPVYCSYTQGGWGAPPCGNNAGTILINYFTFVYNNGFVEVGIPGASGFSLKFTSAAAVVNYLPVGGIAAALSADGTNVLSNSSGVFGGQILALQLNVNFSDAGALQGQVSRAGDLVLNDNTSPLNGKTVRQILALANTALGGGNVSAYGVTISSLNPLIDNLNQAFNGCQPNAWATAHLVSAGNPPPSTGTATASDNCDPHPVVTYSDLVTQGTCPGSSNVVRTWKATDACGNSSICTQTISYQGNAASVCGAVLRDCNADGILTGEAGLPGVTVTLQIPLGLAIATTTTDANGGYCFNNLAAGRYVVVVTPPANYTQTADPDSIKDNKTSVTLTGCQARTGVNFGYAGSAPGVTLKKTGPATAVCGQTITYTFAVTNTGNTCFYGGLHVDDAMLGGRIFYQTPVSPGQGFVFTTNYTVKTTDSTNLVNTATATGHPPTGNPATAQSTWTVKVTLCAAPPLTLTCPTSAGQVGVAYSSAVVASGGTPPYSNYSIISGSLPAGLTLNPANGAITGTPTAAGSFSFKVQVKDSKAVTATATCTSGCSSTATWDFSTPSGPLGPSQAYTVSGLTITAYGFTNASTPAALYGKNLGGDESGLGLSGEVNNEITTNNYVQLDLANLIAAGAANPTMVINSVQLAEKYNIYGSSTLGNVGVLLLAHGTNDNTPFPIPGYPANRFIAVRAAANNVLLAAVNFTVPGACTITIAPPSSCTYSVSGAVVRDCNADGILTGETGLAGVTVTLKNSAGAVVATTTTDANGNYAFANLAAGTYNVVVTQPANYTLTAPPGCANTQIVTLANCQSKTGVSFGYAGAAPGVYFKKTGPANALSGQTITYTFAVTNTGNTCFYGGLHVDDPMLGGRIFYQTPVSPGQGFRFTTNYVVKATDPTNLVNTATATGHPPTGSAVTATSSWTVRKQ